MSINLSNRPVKLAARQVVISCVVPVLNEASLIEAFIKALSSQLNQYSDHYEIIVVDDGSSDTTFELLRDLSVHYPIKALQLSRHFGKEKAITAGLKHVNGDVCVIIDADFQHPLATIGIFLQRWSEGYDMAYGKRISRQDESWLKRTFTRFFYRALNWASQIDIPNNAGDFRLIDARVVVSLNQCQEDKRFMKGLYAWVGYRSCAVPFEVQQRRHGMSRWRYRKLTELALTGFISFSDVPLRAWGLIGLLIAVLSFIGALFIVIKALLTGIVTPGYTSIMVAIIFFGGIQLLSIGILGEYIARIFHEVKKRPTYIVADSFGFCEKEPPMKSHEVNANV